MTSSRLSIVTICFNDLAGLQKTIESLRKQSHFEFEQCIVDGGSSDGTRTYLESIKVPWQLKWISEKDRGIYDAMNKGTAMTTGSHIWYLNSGDYAADSEVVADIVDYIAKSDADIIYGNTYFENEYGRRLIGRKIERTEFYRDMPISHPATIFKKSCLQSAPYRIDYRIVSDWILIKTLFEAHAKSLYVNRTFSVFNLEGVSSKNLWKSLGEKIRFERGLRNRAELVLRSGTKYLILSALDRLGVLPFVRRKQFRRKA